MTLDTEPTIRLPIVDVPSAVITTPHHIARAQATAARRARIQRRWDLLARILSYLLFGGTLGLLIGICGALFALALTLADHDHDGAVPAPDSTTTAAALTLPSMPPTAYPLLGGVAAAPTTTRPAATRVTQRPTSTSTTVTTASATAPAPTPTTGATLPATTAPPPVTEPATTPTAAPPSSTTTTADATTTTTEITTGGSV